MESSCQAGSLAVRDRVGRTSCCHFHGLLTAARSGQRGASFSSVMSASLVFVCACRTSFTSQPPLPAVLPEQSQPPGFPEQSPAPAPGLPQSPFPARFLPGPPHTAHHLPGPPVTQCPCPLFVHFLLHFLSCPGHAPLPSFCTWGLPPPPPCAPQPPEFTLGPHGRQKVPTAAAQTVFANNVTHLVFHHSGMRGRPPCVSVSLCPPCHVLSSRSPFLKCFSPLLLAPLFSLIPCQSSVLHLLYLVSICLLC